MISPESAELFDRLTQETNAKLRAPGDLQSTPERSVSGAPWIEMPVANP